MKENPTNLDIDTSLNKKDVVLAMFELINLSPDAERVILAQSLLYIMRGVYSVVWKAPCCCVFLYGETGTKKTTISAFLNQMYSRSKGIVSPNSLNASIPAAIEILKENNDCVVVLDDLFPADSSQIKGQQEETLIEIARFIADGTILAKMRGKKLRKGTPTCGVLLTGEHIIGTGSDAARLLPVKLSPSPKGEKLKWFQENPLIVSTFYYRFIEWFILNYNDIQDYLKKWLEIYHEVSLGVHDRLQETHYFLNTAYALFLQYCYDKSFIKEQDAWERHSSFLILLNDLIRTQNERVKQNKNNDSDKIDFLERIRTLYKESKLHLAENAKLFSIEHDGLIYNDCLCLRGEKFRDKICKAISSTDYEDVLDALEAQGALKRCRDKRTIQIYGTGGKRFYAIPLDKMQII